MARYLWHSPPRHVRKDLAVNFVSNFGPELRRAFPHLHGRKLLTEVEDLLEDIVRRAVKIAPTQSAIYSEGVMELAVRSLIAAEPRQDKRDVYEALWRQLAAAWYGGT